MAKMTMFGVALALVAMPALVVPALAAPVMQPAVASSGAVARLRAQNDALRERMGQMQLDLLIAEVMTRQDSRAAAIARREAGASAQIVAYRR